ncbi:MAG: hypothetical protein C7B45_00040 [Sulfobacillus acidophilus]|uniref:VWA domain-containing protein n=1 Tax=Sulfobacillus acidophilus TaxID=53633 RepID=A0A2T2WP86_9FIRM|nr:MAG: hypothetical protein C7B45_00040 [Sulfobacillus acidophilus]
MQPSGAPAADSEPPAGLLDGQSDDETAVRQEGRIRAGWALGHDINSGLPESFPAWLLAIHANSGPFERVVRRGQRRGAAVAVDWSKTLKRWSRRGHSDASLVWRKTYQGPGAIAILWDVSGSMASYVDWYFPWLFQVARQRKDVRVFAFGTESVELTPYFLGSYQQAVAAVYAQIHLWGGGTAIGQVFSQWHKAYADQLLDPAARIVVISDGWDAGPPEYLEQVMLRMAQRAREIYWINPLMVTPGFEPRTRALKIALRYTRLMTAGATIDDLRRLTWRWGLEV